MWQEFCDHEVIMIVGVNAEAMEPNAYHTAEYWDVDDSASAVVCRERFMVASRIDVFQNVEALKEHKVDSALATIVGAKTMIAKQVSDCRPAGITWVILEPRAVVLPVTAASTRTTRITSNGLSWDRANPRSLAGGMVSYLVLKRLVIAFDSEELIEGGEICNTTSDKRSVCFGLSSSHSFSCNHLKARDKMHLAIHENGCSRAWFDYCRSVFTQSVRKASSIVDLYNVSTYQCRILLNKMGSLNQKSEFRKTDNMDKRFFFRRISTLPTTGSCHFSEDFGETITRMKF